jgi:hypothetical protein
VPISNILEAILGNVSFVNEADSISAPHAVSYTLGKVAKFISLRDCPVTAIDRVPEQLAVVEKFTSGVVENSKSFVDFVFQA